MSGAAWEGGLALAMGAIVYDVFLAALRRVDHAYPSTDPTESTWWFGYARDLANFLGFLMAAAAFTILGLPAPLALLAAGFWSMIAYGLDFLLARALVLRHPHRVLGGVLVVLAAVTAAAREPIAAGLGGLVRVLF